MKRFFVFLFMLLATFSLASAQTIYIKGTVIDENGEPVIGASVMIKGTLKGDITDVSGRFSLGGVKTTDKLAVSCIGMIPVEVDPQAEMRITLKTDHEQLDEVLVVAFGQQTRSSTNSYNQCTPSVLNSHHPRCSDSTPTSPPSRPANLTVMVNTSLHPSVASVYPPSG